MKSLFHAAIGRLTLGIFLLLVVGSANAQTNAPGPDARTDHAVVRFLGPQDDMLVFNVSYYNPKGSRFVVSIKDQDGNQLYQDVFKDKSFYKQFRLPKTDKDRVVFVFRDGHDADVVKAFEINVNSRFIHEVAIKKVD